MAKEKRYSVIKVRLHPTREQAELMEKTFGCCRYLWNRMLSDVQEFYAAADVQYIPTPARYKREAPFLREVDSQALCAVHQSLRRAFLSFFRSPGAFRRPKFKSKKECRDSFTVCSRPYHTGPSIRMAENGIQMPKLGLVRARLHRRPLHWWSLRSVTVRKTRTGKYFAAITFGYEAEAPERGAPLAEKTVGLNCSLTRFYVDSQGNCPALPRLAESREKLSRMQKKLSRMQKGSKNYEKQLHRLRLQHEHIANQRKDFLHKESRRIANAWDAVCVREDDLTVRPRALRDAADTGFGMFREYLRYKLERQGKWYIPVDAAAPIAKTCHVCGGVNEALGPRDRRWTCPRCGAELVRSVNGAVNLREMGLARFAGKPGAA